MTDRNDMQIIDRWARIIAAIACSYLTIRIIQGALQ
jgi:hypothetical protein